MRPRFEIIRGGKDPQIELSFALQEVLSHLPEKIDSLIDMDTVLEKREEFISWTDDELLAYLRGENLFADSKTASATWAVMDIVKGKTVPPIA